MQSDNTLSPKSHFIYSYLTSFPTFLLTLHFVKRYFHSLLFNFFRGLSLVGGFLILIIVAACSSSRHVPQGSFLLNKVNISIDDSTGQFKADKMINYVRQMPNHKVLWLWKLQLGIYNMSGRDTARWYNRWIRRLGEAPVIYDSTLTELSQRQLQLAMVNKGFLDASVDVDTIIDAKHRKIKVQYNMNAGEPHRIATINFEIPDSAMRRLVMMDSNLFSIRPGDLLDRDLLDKQRELMSQRLRNNGYWAFSKEYITFSADTTQGSTLTDLTVIINDPRKINNLPNKHLPYSIRRIRVITDYDPLKTDSLGNLAASDTVDYKDLQIFYGPKQWIRPGVIYENCYLRQGGPFTQQDVDRTYEAFGRLNILKFVDIRFEQVPSSSVSSSESQELDAYILLTRSKSQSIAFELEGTNSEGDLGVAASITYTNRNIGHGSETLTTKLRAAYESLSGNLDGIIHNRYLETSLEASLNFPKFKAPFLRESFKRKVRASTELSVSLTYQERPEYTRVASTAAWSYIWAARNNRSRHIFTPIDINYVYLPASTNGFLDLIAPDNPLLRYSYEDHFIMSMRYNYYHTTKRRELPWTRTLQSNISTIRVSVETAGNLLFAISETFSPRRHPQQDPYKVFGIRYSQYVKAEADYSFLHIFDHRNSLALHAGLGLAYPYGNTRILPFEKRFYGGGANGVRGWDVRTLGPGSYSGSNTVSDFINQCGDIRLDLSMEYRAKLFWIIELGLFIDAGNIWTIHSYPTQPGGMFRFNSFYKQLAASYGAGIRLDFDYFLIRFDLGMKAHNPAKGQEPWPIFHPRWGRDRSFHFSIGYPF